MKVADKQRSEIEKCCAWLDTSEGVRDMREALAIAERDCQRIDAASKLDAEILNEQMKI